MIGAEVGACLQTSDLRAALQRLILSQLRNGLRALQRRPDPTSCSGGRTASASVTGLGAHPMPA